jgi:hypothetical protein
MRNDINAVIGTGCLTIMDTTCEGGLKLYLRSILAIFSLSALFFL